MAAQARRGVVVGKGRGVVVGSMVEKTRKGKPKGVVSGRQRLVEERKRASLVREVGTVGNGPRKRRVKR